MTTLTLRVGNVSCAAMVVISATSVAITIATIVFFRIRSSRDAASLLLQGDVGILDDLAPVAGLLVEKGNGLFTRAARRLHLHGVESVADQWTPDHLADIATDAVGQGGRRCRRRNQTEPCDRTVGRVSRFRDSRN